VLAGRFRKLSIRYSIKLAGILFSKPFLILPTLDATRETLKLSEKLFPNEHHADNKANAFRHALWNYLICVQCLRVSKSVERVIAWSKKITDLHEDLAPNSKIARAMDLHNNKIGRDFFAENREFQQENINKLRRKLHTANKISSVEDIKPAKNELVYIED